MTPLASVADVEARLKPANKHLATDDADYTSDLIDEATVKVLAHLGKSETFFDAEDIPATVTIVTSRMVSRVLEQGASNVIPGTTQAGETTGPFSNQVTFVAGAGNGSPWLTKSDKADLDNAYGANKVFGVDRVASGTIHAEWCSLNFGANYCSCGADIAGYPIYSGPT